MQSPPYARPVTLTTSRREQNKARTREALLGAIRSRVSAHGVEALTVEDITEEAGVSRRTFFNYFASIEAALVEGTSLPLTSIEQAFLARPVEEDQLTAIMQALEVAPISVDLLTWMHALACSTEQASGKRAGKPTAIELNVWQHHRGWLEDLLGQRERAGDALHTATLAAAIMGMFEAIEAEWVQRVGDTVDETAVSEFNTLIMQALGHARAGWSTPGPDGGSPSTT